MWDVITFQSRIWLTRMPITIFLLFYCAVRLLFIKSVDRFYLAIVFSIRQTSSRTVFFSASGNYSLYKERFSIRIIRQEELSALCAWMKNLQTSEAATYNLSACIKTDFRRIMCLDDYIMLCHCLCIRLISLDDM